MKNICITGHSGLGKTNLINLILMLSHENFTGFKTLRHFDSHIKTGFDIVRIENSSPIKESRIPIFRFGETKNHIYTENFNKFSEYSKDFSNYVIMDEIGRFESEAKEFLEMIEENFENKNRHVIAVIKHMPGNKFADSLMNRSDTYTVNLDLVDYDRAVMEILSILNLKNIYLEKYSEIKRMKTDDEEIFYESQAKGNLLFR